MNYEEIEKIEKQFEASFYLYLGEFLEDKINYYKSIIIYDNIVFFLCLYPTAYKQWISLENYITSMIKDYKIAIEMPNISNQILLTYNEQIDILSNIKNQIKNGVVLFDGTHVDII